MPHSDRRGDLGGARRSRPPNPNLGLIAVVASVALAAGLMYLLRDVPAEQALIVVGALFLAVLLGTVALGVRRGVVSGRSLIGTGRPLPWALLGIVSGILSAVVGEAAPGLAFLLLIATPVLWTVAVVLLIRQP